MSEEKQTPIGLIVGIVAVVAVVAFVLGKGSGNEQQATKPTEPEKPAEPATPAEPTPPHPDAIEWKGSWYVLLNDKNYSVTQARAKAKSLGAHLPHLDSNEEEKFLIGLAKGAKIPIGAILNESGWTWSDGSNFNYVNWGGGQGARHPAETLGENGDFVILRDGSWSDVDISDESRFACPVVLEWKKTK